MEYRDEVNRSEERLLKVLGPVSDFALRVKRIRRPEYTLTLSQVVDYAMNGGGYLVNTQSVEKLLNRKVSQICRAGSRFSKNCLCVALYGDSDNVMRWAVKHGALAVVTDHQIDNLPCVIVESPESFYSEVCGYFRTLSPVKITAVAGSIGKTTTKRMITSVYQKQFPTFNDPENENQMDCVGYICQHIPHGTKMLVQEVSEDTPGCMRLMSKMLRPEIVVITAVDKSHIEQFGTQSKIYEEICSVTNDMSKNGIVIINADDKELVGHLPNRKIVTIALEDKSADFYATNIRIDKDGLRFTITDKLNNKSFEDILLHNIFARHNAFAALYAFAAGVCSGESYENILKGIVSYRTLGIRQNIYDSEDGVKLYVDCYNAIGKSVEAAIEAASQIPVSGNRIAVIGDVEEAGEESASIHKNIVSVINKSNFNYLFTFGSKIKKAVESINHRENLFVKTYLEKKALAKDLYSIAHKGDIVLFKASRKSALETIIEYLWPKSYKKEMRSYSMAKIRWRIKIIFS